ncbi:MAG: hypothetical protein AAFN59_05980 [Pseudomonadota bacterium]
MRIVAILIILVSAVVLLEDMSGPGGLKFSSAGSKSGGFSSASSAVGGVTSAGTNAARNLAQ